MCSRIIHKSRYGTVRNFHSTTEKVQETTVVIYSLKEIAGSAYYRTHPLQSLQFLYSKFEFARRRLNDPAEMVKAIGLEPVTAFSGFDRWSDMLYGVVSEVAQVWGQGGINMPEGKFLFAITRTLRPQIVIETGVAAGVSSCFLMAALIENGVGTLYSIDLPVVEVEQLNCADASHYAWPRRGVGWAIPDDLRKQIGSRHKMVLEDVRTALPRLLGQLKNIDFFFHDDLHLPDHMLWEYECVWNHLREGGVLASHDVNMGWIRFCRNRGLSRHRLTNLNRLCAVRKGSPNF